MGATRWTLACDLYHRRSACATWINFCESLKPLKPATQMHVQIIPASVGAGDAEGLAPCCRLARHPVQLSDIKLHLGRRGQRATKSCHLPLGNLTKTQLADSLGKGPFCMPEVGRAALRVQMLILELQDESPEIAAETAPVNFDHRSIV